MSDRLKDIWRGFEAKTSRHLTGGGVENIVAHRREREDLSAGAPLPADFVAPAEAAFTALKSRLAAAETRAGRRNRKARRGGAVFATEDAADLNGSEISLAGAPEPAVEMIRGLKATEARTERAEISYSRFMAQNAGRKLDGLKKRRKFLGLF